RNGFLTSAVAWLATGVLAAAEPSAAARLPASAAPPQASAGPAEAPAADMPAEAGIWCPPTVPLDDRGADCYRLWASAEYLLWWTKDSRLPPLVESGKLGGTTYINLDAGDVG